MEPILTSQQQVLESLKSSLSSGAYSDLTVVCAGNTHKVHKVVVCGRSKFFARAIQFGGQESQTSTIDLSEDEPEIVALLVQYLYGGEYDPILPPTALQVATPTLSTPVKPGKVVSKRQKSSFSFPHTCYNPNYGCEDDRLCPHHLCRQDCAYTCRGYTCGICAMPSLEGSSSQLLIHTKMYEMADKYEVVGLKELATEKFSRSCRHFWDTLDFPVAAHHAFSTTPEGDTSLRNLVSQTIASHMGLAQKPEVRALLMQFNGLALGILDAKSEELGWGAIGTVKGV